MTSRPHVVVVGAGLVGLATAYQILRLHHGITVIVIDKEQAVARHQSGRNSGVIHSGIYYTPDSAKARNCRRGRQMLLDFCRTHDIPHELCGKVVVAVDHAERPALHAIAGRGKANGVAAALIDRDELGRLEPHVRGVEALRVDDAGIVDYRGMADHLAAEIRSSGGEILLGAPVRGLTEGFGDVRVQAGDVEITAQFVISCAGLHSDRVAGMALDRPPSHRIVPFRGEYYELVPEATDLCRSLIYPVPDPRYPFLGVHLTRHIDGRVLAGPNAVLALAREGYGWSQVSWRDSRDLVSDAAVWALARQHWRTGVGETWRSLSRRAFTRALQRMTPEIRSSDLRPALAGVRAQALRSDGSLEDDFVIERSPRGLFVLNAPSPAATASMAIGETLAAEVAQQLR